MMNIIILAQPILSLRRLYEDYTKKLRRNYEFTRQNILESTYVDRARGKKINSKLHPQLNGARGNIRDTAKTYGFFIPVIVL